MSRMRTAALHRWAGAVLICTAWTPFEAAAQGRSFGFASKLERAGVIDTYFPEIAFEVAGALALAVPRQWQGVQINRPHRPG